MCRWAQYINALSDATRCDPGSIIAMAGELGFEACGAQLWRMDKDAKPLVHVGRGYACAANYNPKLTNTSTGARLARHEDVMVANDARATEEFWYAANGHSHAPPDGEIEYSGEATASAHVIGRVTCPLTGQVAKDGRNPHIRSRRRNG